MDTNNYFIRPYNSMADHDPYVQPFAYVGRPQFQPQPLIYPINDHLMMMMIPDHYYMQPSYYMDPYNSRSSAGVWINSSDHHPSMYGTLVDEVTLITEPPTYTGFVQLVDGLVQVVNFDEIMEDQQVGGRDYYDDLFEIDEQMRLVSYEDLLEMEERVGRVNVGLSEETISKHLKTSSSGSTAACCSRVDDHSKESEEGAEICVVCQYEYESNETVGTLHCGHRYHADCIKEWLLQHNVCPICKSTALQV